MLDTLAQGPKSHWCVGVPGDVLANGSCFLLVQQVPLCVLLLNGE